MIVVTIFPKQNDIHAIPTIQSLMPILSKKLVVRRAYFDSRHRDGHSNAVVFVLEAGMSVNKKSFSGYRVGSAVSTKFKFRIPQLHVWAVKTKQ